MPASSSGCLANAYFDFLRGNHTFCIAFSLSDIAEKNPHNQAVLTILVSAVNACPALSDHHFWQKKQNIQEVVPDHDGGRPTEVNACILITHMVYF